MAIKQQLDADLKAAMLAGEKERAEVLRGLKSAILYEEVAQKKRDVGLDEAEVEKVIAREGKKRDEAAELFARGGNLESAEKERREKEILSTYLPKQLDDSQLEAIVFDVVKEFNEDTHMGKIIGAVKSKVGNQADGARVAAAVRKALQ